jgi:hypothetical protein
MIVMRVLAIVLACATPLNAADNAKLRTLSGKTIEGELVRITQEEVVVRTKDGSVSTSAAEVLDLELPAASPPAETKYSDVELVDTSLLHVSKVSIRGDQVSVKLVGGPEVQIPLSAVSYVLHEAQDPKVREEWQSLLAGRANQDLLAIKDAAGKVNPLPGTFGKADEEGTTIEFEPVGAAKRGLKLARIHGMSFWRKRDEDVPAAICRVHDAAKNVIAAAKVEFDDSSLRLTTPAGITIAYQRGAVARLDFSQGKLAYLSDLEPRVIERSNLDWVDHYRRDRGLDGGAMRLGKETYGKGLALHAYTELIYDLNGQYNEFKSVIGVDPKVGGDSHVDLLIEGDGRKLFDANVTRKTEPRPVTLDVKNVKQLRIVVRSSRLLGLGDHINLADAKVSK